MKKGDYRWVDTNIEEEKKILGCFMCLNMLKDSAWLDDFNVKLIHFRPKKSIKSALPHENLYCIAYLEVSGKLVVVVVAEGVLVEVLRPC